MTHPGGRPLKFATPEEMQQKIDEYFKSCEDELGKLIKPISITGLAIYLDTYRDLLCNYEERDEFYDTVKKAKQRVENFYEERLTLNAPAGSIFALKNFDWRDKIESEVSTPPGRPFETRNMSEADIDARINELARKTGVTGPAGRKAKDKGKK
jgi:hypothetical protein